MKIIRNLCEKCGIVIPTDRGIWFDFTNEPIVSKRIVKNIQGWGSFPNSCIEVTFEDGSKDHRSLNQEFTEFPDMKHADKFIIRKSKPKEIMEIYERMGNGYMVELKGKYFYIPHYTDLLSLGKNKDYKHPLLAPNRLLET